MRARAHHTVTRHPLHLAMIVFIQPCLQLGFGAAEMGIGNTNLLKTQFSTPLFNVLCQEIEIEGL